MSFYGEVQIQGTKASKCPHFAWTRQEVIKANGWSHHRWRFAPDCPTHQSNAASDRQSLTPLPDECSPASYHTPWGQQGWVWGCCEATDWEQWKPEPLTAV